MTHQKNAPIFFSQRMGMARLAEVWCLERGAALSAVNIVTALVDMGIIKKKHENQTPPMKTLPPCDHDDCPPTHCKRVARPANAEVSGGRPRHSKMQ